MSPFTIRCFKPGSAVPDAIFILSKGRNTGRPSWTQNPNCFFLTCENPADLDGYYWLLYSLWSGGKFHEHLCGSVIEFIHIRDLKKLVAESVLKVTDIQKVASTMKQVVLLEEHLTKQLSLISQAKKAVMRTSVR